MIYGGDAHVAIGRSENECLGVDDPWRTGAGVDIGRLSPTVDMGRQQPSLFNQFRHETFGNRFGAPLRTFRPWPWRHSIMPPVNIEVAGDVAKRPDA